MKRFLAVIAAVTALSLAASAPVLAAPQPSDYTVAEVPFSTAGGDAVVSDELRLLLCIDNDYANCLTHTLDGLVFPPLTEASAGNTIWADTSALGFGGFVAQITDGDVDLLGYAARVNVSGPGWFVATESDFFGEQVGPSGNDLAGYAIHRIGFRVDAISLNSPGEDPNGDGVWTDFSLRGSFVFEGTIASSESCKDGGWQKLHGPDGVPFKNQGECIQFVTSGK